jgi:uncharacterized surface protein with fasciclin (FAS1) repeats
MDIVSERPELATFMKAINIADMNSILRGYQNISLFAPTDEAFAQWPIEELARLFDNPAALGTLLEFHISEERISSSEAKTRDYAVMMTGTLTSLDYDGLDLFIDDAKFVVKDIPATNGVLHIIDTVLEP